MSWVIYATDALIFILFVAGFGLLLLKRRSITVKIIVQKVLLKPQYIISGVILATFIAIGFMDSIHFKIDNESFSELSVLDMLLRPRNTETEVSYSAPFAIQSYVPEIINTDTGRIEEMYPRLEFAGQNLRNSEERLPDILYRILRGLLQGVAACLIILLFTNFALRKKFPKSFWLIFTIIVSLVFISANLMFEYHILGTDKIGRDVFYITLKSIRTGLIIGSLTTLIMLPFALLFGMLAGYFPGFVDDAIQYVYITLSSIPPILLIAAAVVSLQIRIETSPDLKLLLLCVILGLTSWTTLCRYVRGETLKLKDSEFVQAAITLGTRKSNILWRHILPNLMHIVIITLVLDFSGLVLAEAVLTYIGVGVDAATYSWGTMINAARLEMGRDPIVWWSLSGALLFMFTLVFSANIFSEAIQEALSPRRE